MLMEDIIVRAACRDDLLELIRLAEQWLNPLFDKVEKMVLLEQLLQLMEDVTWDRAHYIYVVEEGNKLLGFCDFLIWWDWLTFKKRLLIQHVYVDEDYRQRGIGTILLKTILDIFNPNFAMVDTKPEKFPHAKALYEKLGFKVNNKRIWLEK